MLLGNVPHRDKVDEEEGAKCCFNVIKTMLSNKKDLSKIVLHQTTD